MVEEGERERFNELLIEKRDFMSRKNLLKYTRSNFEGFEFEKHRIPPRDLFLHFVPFFG